MNNTKDDDNKKPDETLYYLEKTNGEYLNGEYISYYDNGELEYFGFYKNGNKVGEWKSYFDNGEISSINHYDEDGVKIGEWMDYFGNKKIYEIIIYNINNSKKSILKRYYANGQLQYTGHYKYEFEADSVNVKIGEWKRFFENGVLEGTTMYNSDGEPCLYKIYYENGQLKKFSNVLYGKKCIRKSYYENGNIRRTFERGEENVFYENGNLKETIKFNYNDNPERNGAYKRYDENGQLLWYGNYKDGEPIGEWKGYWENGSLRKIYNYRDDSVVEVKLYYGNGNLISESASVYSTIGDSTIFHQKKGVSKQYYKNGSIESITDYSDEIYVKSKVFHPNGKVYFVGKSHYNTTEQSSKGKTGEQRYYFTNGVLRRKENYEDGKMDGKYEEYYKNGTLKEIRNYKKGEYNGEYEFYYENGVLQESGTYKDDHQNGEWKSFHKNGKTHEIILWDLGKLMDLISCFDINGVRAQIGSFINGNGIILYGGTKRLYKDGEYIKDIYD